MNNYNPNFHHRRSIRLKDYDYSREGFYFITICIQDRKRLFGKIVVAENFLQQMILNDLGKIADECWSDIPKHFPNTVLHEYIVMPNHVHGIIELIKTDPLAGPVRAKNMAGAKNILPLPSFTGPQRNDYQKIIPHSIGSIVRGFKIGVTKWYRNKTDRQTKERDENSKKLWQRNYYEHIIRDEKSFQRISEYIRNNPENWNEDDFFNV